MKSGYKYTAETIERALDVHKSKNRILGWKRTNRRYLITTTRCETLEMSLHEAHAFVYGLQLGAETTENALDRQ